MIGGALKRKTDRPLLLGFGVIFHRPPKHSNIEEQFGTSPVEKLQPEIVWHEERGCIRLRFHMFNVRWWPGIRVERRWNNFSFGMSTRSWRQHFIRRRSVLFMRLIEVRGSSEGLLEINLYV